MRELLVVACALVSTAGNVSFAQESKLGKKARNTSPAFDSLKQLVGEWSGTGKNGNPVETMFRLTSGGSVIVETLHPGKPSEMVSMYYMDGPNLMLTHYCLRGNQPQLKAESVVKTKELSFKAVGGTNMKLTDYHMGQADFKLVDEDHFEVVWTSFTDGKPDGYQNSFKFTRKK